MTLIFFPAGLLRLKRQRISSTGFRYGRVSLFRVLALPLVVLFVPLLGLAEVNYDPAYTFTTLAGLSRNRGISDGVGNVARFDYPEAVTFDAAGNIYVADSYNHTIRKITSGGVVTTLAGSAKNPGWADGTGVAAQFSEPAALGVDSQGNVYVADSGNFVIRKITPAGVVTTFAGTRGLGWADGQGTAASFNHPFGLAVSATGNIYVADTFNSTIRKITPDGLVTTIAGAPGQSGWMDGIGSAARFAYPHGIAVDQFENLYVADSQRVIRKITPTGIVTTLAGSPDNDGSTDGTGSAARFWGAVGVAVDGEGTVYVADTNNYTLRKISTSNVVTTLAGLAGGDGSSDGASNAARFWYPAGIAIDAAHHIYIADTDNNTIRKGDLAPTSAPVITTQPVSQTEMAGASVTWTVVASGNPAPTFQWKKNGADISGATGNSYTIANVTAADTGSFTVVVTNSAGSATSAAAVLTVVPPVAAASATPADFDGDGQSDLFWQNTVTGERSFWLMNGTTLKVGVSLGTFAPDWTIVGSGDFNHDGQADLLWQNTITGERTIWLMNGTALSLGVNIGTYSTDIRIMGSGDFNGDGETDIVVQNTITGEATIWLMNGTTKVSEASLGIMPTAWSIAGTGDFNGDGKKDLVWQNAATGERSVWLMNGRTKSSEVSLGIVAKEQQIVGTGDYNHDGKTDLVWTNTQTGERTIWLMNGLVPINKVIFTLLSVEWSLGRPIFVTAQTAHADFNADGQTDVIWQNNATGERSISLMNGTTSTSSISLGTMASNWVISGTGDFNHDDKPDLVWTNTTTGERTVWLMDGTTMLSNVPLTTVSPVWEISAIGDFNYDGKPDLVWTNTVTGERAIWLMNGTVFGSGISLGTLSKAWKIATTADLNGDGKTDLIWQNTSTGECSVWLMNGGALASGVALDTLPVQWSIVGSGDFNGDGKADLLLQNTVTGERVVRLMNRTAFLSTISLGVFDTHLSVGN